MHAPTDNYRPGYVCSRCMRINHETVMEAIKDRDELKLGETVDEMDSFEFGLVWQLLGSGDKTILRKLMSKVRGNEWTTVEEANDWR